MPYTLHVLHVALATIAGCNMIVSWNFKHLVNFRRIPLFNAVKVLNGYKPISIYSPMETQSKALFFIVDHLHEACSS